MSSEAHYKAARKVAGQYTEEGYDVLAIDSNYPGILEDSVPEHEAEGKVDILLSQGEDIDPLKVVEIGRPSSLDEKSIVRRYNDTINQAIKNASYFEDLGYETEAEIEMRPEGELKTLQEIYENTTGVFTWNQLLDTVSDPERLGSWKQDEKIVFCGLSNTKSELYSLNPELEEVTDVFLNDIV